MFPDWLRGFESFQVSINTNQPPVLLQALLSGECVGAVLGREFTEVAPWTLDDVFPDSSAQTPIIFVLSTGADPTAMLQRFATKMGWVPGERLHIVSLGQGQGPVAEALVGPIAPGRSILW